MSSLRIGGSSLNQTPIDWDNNVSNILEAIDAAKASDVKILCLPELCITGYGCEDLFLSNWVPEKALEILLEIIPHCQGICVAVGLPYRLDGKLYNTTCIVENTAILGFYAKQVLANDGIHYEHRWFHPWKSEEVTKIQFNNETYSFGDLTFEVQNIKVGIEICEDAWSDSRPACRLHKKGVQLIINPSASHFSFQKSKTRERLVSTSSSKFNCAYLYVNQLGNESGRVIYDGDVIVGAAGNVVARNKRFSFQKVNALYFDFLPETMEIKALNSYEDWDSKNDEMAQASALGLFDYLRKSRAKGYVVSLSGGADSSCVAVLVAEMVKNGIKQLGTQLFLERIHRPDLIDLGMLEIMNHLLTTAYQGTRNSSDGTFNSAKSLAISIGAKFRHWDIEQLVSDNTAIIENATGRSLTWESDDIALQNIQARVRSPLIWMMANLSGHILLTTSNRSEGDVGYTTMDGDTSGSLAPIAGIDKPFILEWLQYAEKELGYSGLEAVNNLSPSAELRPTSMEQNDEDDLMPYDVLKQIESLTIHKRLSPIDTFIILEKETGIEKNRLKEYLQKFYRLWSINQWKRERLAPSFHLDDFNVDPKTWCRFPILSGSFRSELEQLSRL